MKDKILKIAKRVHRQRVSEPVEYLLRDEAISGKLILVALALAIIAANSPLAPWYEAFLHMKLSIGLGDFSLSLDIKHWISEGLMVFFFLVVGLELKRELMHGDLRHRKTAVLPLAAAIGGMVVPALIYLSFNLGRDTVAGWAIPTATDIALAIGILGLLGNRIPSSLRVFILALAIIDDILAVIIIAAFYNPDVNVPMLAAMLAVASQIYLLGRLHLLRMWIFIVAGIALWLMAHASGIHASIVGALLGLIAPMTNHRHPGRQIAEKVEHAVVPFSTLVVIPLFAFANTGISFNFSNLHFSSAAPLGAGIIAGLLAGKFVGIFGATWLMVKFKFADLPARTGWGHIAGVGMLAGIGFTVAIFVTELAFTDDSHVLIAKLSIFVASLLAAIAGLVILRFAKTRKPE